MPVFTKILDKNKLIQPLFLWAIFFCYSLFIALFFQKLVLPLFPSLHANFGLLNADAIYFHTVAENIANYIQLNGYSWEAFWPNVNGARGNVALLGLLYSLFGNDPSLILPVNTGLHAFSGVLIYLISKELSNHKIGIISGVISATLFVMLPSTLNWYAQVHKDGFAIAGTLLTLYVWLFYFNKNIKKKIDGVIYILASLVGMLLILFVRPYNLYFLTLALSFWFTLTLLYFLYESKLRVRVIYLLLSLVLVVIFGGIAKYSSNVLEKTALNAYEAWMPAESMEDQKCKIWDWEDDVDLIIPGVNNLVEKVARTRAGLTCSKSVIQSASTIDADVIPSNVLEVIGYVPRGLQIALFAPFPDMWKPSAGIARIIGVLEIVIWYLLVPGFIYFLYKKRTFGLLLVLVFATTYLSIYGFTIANLGSLHRVRYPFLFLYMMIGVLGWVTIGFKKGWFNRSDIIYNKSVLNNIGVTDAPLDKNESIKAERNEIVVGGWIVAILTGITYIGFFFRDIIVANTFGVGDDLDAFFIALLIPMLFVNVFCQAYATSSVPNFIKINQYNRKLANIYVGKLSGLISISLLMVCGVMYLFSSNIVSLVGISFSYEKLEMADNLFRWSLPLLLFSGVIILGNNILNSCKKYSITAFSQLIVPIVSIVFLLLFGDKYGVVVVLWGMIFGQILNLLLIQYFLAKDGFSVITGRVMHLSSYMKESGQQFAAIAIAALFTQLAITIDNGMASTLQAGSVSILSIGSKLIYFLTGILGTTISFVVLPYFVTIIFKNNLKVIRHELTVMVYIATIVGIVVSGLMYVITEPLLYFVFNRGVINTDEVSLIVKVVYMGLIQIPFFASQLVILKYATASYDNKIILVVSLVGLSLNILLNYILMQYIGVLGIMLATSISMLFVAMLSLMLMSRKGDINLSDLIFISLIWMLFLSFVLCVYVNSLPGIVVSLIGLSVAFSFFYIKLFKKELILDEVNV